jgi:hypothetical protein
LLELGSQYLPEFIGPNMHRLLITCSALLMFWIVVPTFLFAEHVFPARDVLDNGELVSWWGSRTVFVGSYTWPEDDPLGVYNGAGNQLVNRADLSISGCDLKASTCSTDSHLLFGGLPPGTEVKFVTSGSLPGGLVSWQEDKTKTYYIEEWKENNFRLADTPNGPAIKLDERIKGEGTHGMSFAGYMHVMSFFAAHAIRFSCEPETDICTSEEPHLFTASTWVSVYSSGKLPEGLTVFSAGRYYRYCIVPVTPTTFKLAQTAPDQDTPCNTPGLSIAHIRSKGTGVHYLYGLHLPANSAAGARNPSIMIQDMSGYPAGTVLTWRNQQSVAIPAITSNGLSQTDSATHSVTMFAKVPAVTPPGDYRITVKTSEDRASNREPNAFQYTLRAVTLPVVSTAGPKDYPKIPGLKTWEEMMTSANNGGGSALSMYPRCANRKHAEAPLGWANPQGVVTLSNTGTPYPVAYSGGSNARVWFYNDETFFKIARYTNDSTWANCGVFIAAAMRDKFLTQGPNAMQAIFYFPWTMVAAYKWTKDPGYKDAVISIADSGAFSKGWVSDMLLREHAFAFERRLAKREVTGEEDPDLPYFAEASLAQLYINATASPERTMNEPFMLGLAMRPLIRWYMISHDERIPVVIRLLLDRIWDEWYDHRHHHFYYNPEPPGMRCSVSCQKFTSSDLNDLVAPAYAWYWRLTGDETYRMRGDDMFAHQYDDNPPYNAKEWSQGFYWSWDFVEWREGKKAAY